MLLIRYFYTNDTKEQVNIDARLRLLTKIRCGKRRIFLSYFLGESKIIQKKSSVPVLNEEITTSFAKQSEYLIILLMFYDCLEGWILVGGSKSAAVLVRELPYSNVTLPTPPDLRLPNAAAILGWKFMSNSHCRELCQQASWLLISFTRVNNQSEARSAS